PALLAELHRDLPGLLPIVGPAVDVDGDDLAAQVVVDGDAEIGADLRPVLLDRQTEIVVAPVPPVHLVHLRFGDTEQRGHQRHRAGALRSAEDLAVVEDESTWRCGHAWGSGQSRPSSAVGP